MAVLRKLTTSTILWAARVTKQRNYHLRCTSVLRSTMHILFNQRLEAFANSANLSALMMSMPK
eukprot:10988919-Alexandrium_andersonii.AAC.1